jgi:hypothetical protein
MKLKLGGVHVLRVATLAALSLLRFARPGIAAAGLLAAQCHPTQPAWCMKRPHAMVSPGESPAKAAQTRPFSKTAALEPLSSFSKAAAPSGFVPSINANAAATSGSATRALESHSSAASTAFAEAVCESGVALSDVTFVRLRGALLSRMSSATPHLLTSGRTTCPSCNGELCQTSLSQKQHPQASSWIFAEPVVFKSRTCHVGVRRNNVRRHALGRIKKATRVRRNGRYVTGADSSRNLCEATCVHTRRKLIPSFSMKVSGF